MANSNLRILFHDYAGHAFAVQLSRQLAHRGHEVRHVYCMSTHTPQGVMTSRPGDADGFSVRPIDLGRMIPKTGYLQRLRMECDYGNLLVEACREFSPDVVLSAQTPSIPQWRLARECSRRGIRHIFWVQDLYGLAASKLLARRIPMIGQVIGNYFMWLDRKTARHSDKLVLITEDFRSLFLKWRIDPQRIHILHNWSVLDELPLRPRDNDWSRDHHLTVGPRFLYSGTMAMKHNPRLLLELAKRLDARGFGEVVVVSEGLGIDWLRREADAAQVKSLRFFPFQPFEQVADVLGSADILVSLLDAEAGAFCVPSKVLSYLCAGRAVLGAMPLENLAARVVTDHNAGRVVEPDDEVGFLAAAMELLESPELRTECGTAARNYAEANFDIDRIADRMESLLTESIPATGAAENIGAEPKSSYTAAS